MSNWILLRGLTREARHWGNFPCELSARLNGTHITAIDLPGNGGHCDIPSPRNISAMMEFSRRELAASHIAPPYHLLALSLGGMVAAHWCAQHRDEIAGCVLINSSVRGINPFWQRLRPRSYISLLRLLLSNASARERLVLQLTSTRADTQSDVLDRWTQYATENPVTRRNALNQILAAVNFQAPAQAPPVPMLILAAAADRLVNPECSRRLAERWQTPLVIHPYAGHDLPLDDGAWVIDRIESWLALRTHQ